MKDKILENLMKQEEIRQNSTLNLIASENIVSQDVLKTLGSVLTNKYSEGYPQKRYYAGNDIIDKIEILAQERARKVFKLNKNWAVNVQPYSGSPANLAIYSALLNPNDKILGLELSHGGHLTHGAKVNFSGKFFHSISYPVTKNGIINYQKVLEIAKKEKPRIIVCGATAYSQKIDFKKFSEIAKSCGAYLLADISHIAGLIAGGVHPSPFPYADVVMTTTHKTLRGPRGAIIFTNKNSLIAKKNKIDVENLINKSVFPGIQGGPHNNQTAAIATALYEVLKPNFKIYAKQIVKNAKALAEELKKQNFSLISGGTENHLILINLEPLNISGLYAQKTMELCGIIVNKNTIPNDTRKPSDPSGIRLGTPALTTRGMKEKEMKKIAELISRVLIKKESVKLIKKEVEKLCKKFPVKK